MKLNSQYFTLGAFVIVAGLLWFYYSEYQDKAEKYASLTLQYDKQTIAINQQQERIKHLAELDKVHTQELAHAKTEIDTLRADVAAGRRKLRIKATCPVRETPSSGSVGDAGTPQLTEAARQDYFRLREMMAENERQIKYLQEYVRGQCIN
ncbi:lysis protein [Xenorhabdus koppenhoeferi]|uniref:Prophage endopeptidase n=1 Tax=Xenorhabdus koppenhoeferi TaxID=351659 RepID=A0A1I7K7V9_9GAMM|nr:lysis protein [Xenorhabdus koppenhoeferi]SFU93490.1 prophage endopeptidase [Xenorhabdus koppenhoeferi]